MLTANYLVNVAEPLVELWSQVECDIIKDVSRRLVSSGGKLTATAQWQILKAREMGILQTDIASSLAKATRQSEKATYKLVVDACEEALAFDDAIYIKAGYAPIPLAQSSALMEVVNAGIRKTNGLMSNFTNTTAQTASKAFENCLDRAYMQVISGAFSYDTALRNAVRDLAQKGIQKIVYPSGSTIHMDAASRRALITGLNQTTAELQLARMEQLDTYLVEVTSHASARPSHAQWHGQVYWHGEKVRGYDNLEDATGYGTGDGLCGWNCYHSFFPYFEGLSHRVFERDPSARRGKSNEQMYEESQHQRNYERKIRQSRRECAAYSAARDAARDPETKASLDAAFQQAAARLKQQEQALTEYCERTERTKLPDRLFVPSYNRRVSAQATWAVGKNKE